MGTRRSPKGRGAGGFTLVELLLVLVILALIGGLVLPGIIGKAEGAKVKAASRRSAGCPWRWKALPRHRRDLESLDLLVEESATSAAGTGLTSSRRA
jgi:prepilin-type N-terminal cleavage/methylation domain-containing protein